VVRSKTPDAINHSDFENKIATSSNYRTAALPHGPNKEATDVTLPERDILREMYDLDHVIKLEAAGREDFKATLDEDEAVPREIPSSYRYNAGEVLRQHLYGNIDVALMKAFEANAALRHMLSYRSLYEAWKHHVVEMRARGVTPMAYASFLHSELLGNAAECVVAGSHAEYAAKDRIINMILDAMAAGKLPALADNMQKARTDF
jgi:hypothetical protein